MKFEVECEREFYSLGTALIYLIHRVSGIRKDEFAKRLGVDQATLTRWQKGSFFPQDELAERVSDATGGIIQPDMWYQRIGPLTVKVEIKRAD